MITDIDTLVGFWPRRRCDISPERLQADMARHGIGQAWACSARGIWYDDEEGNRETGTIAARYPNLVPVATIDPRKYVGAPEEVRRCIDAGIRVFRLFPEYQGWLADSPSFRRTLSLLDEAGVVTIIGGTMTQLLPELKGMRAPVILAGAHLYQLADALACLGSLPNVYLSTRLLIGPGSVDVAVECLGAERLVFGSHAPLEYQAAALRTLQAASLTAEQMDLVASANARRLLGDGA